MSKLVAFFFILFFYPLCFIATELSRSISSSLPISCNLPQIVTFFPILCSFIEVFLGLPLILLFLTFLSVSVLLSYPLPSVPHVKMILTGFSELLSMENCLNSSLIFPFLIHFIFICLSNYSSI